MSPHSSIPSHAQSPSTFSRHQPSTINLQPSTEPATERKRMTAKTIGRTLAPLLSIDDTLRPARSPGD